MRNNAREVLAAWIHGEKKVSGSISTDGEYIRSYDLPIAFRDKYGRVTILSEKRSPSKTTLTHIRACRTVCPHAKEEEFEIY